MMLEHALLSVTPGREEEFEASMREALPVITSAHDCFGAEVRRQHEDPSVYLLLVRWSSVEAHMAFRDTDLFEQWRQLTHPFYSEKPTVTHFHDPLDA
jgi:heme-degrading monooxygenase HmoA